MSKLINNWLPKLMLLACNLLFFVAIKAQLPRMVLPLGHVNRISGAIFSPDGKLIVTASWDKTAKVWNAASGELILDLRGHTQGINSAVFSPDGKLIVTASGDYTAKVWNAATGLLMADLTGHSRALISATFSADSKWIVTACEEPIAKIWNAATGQLAADLKGHIDNVKSASFSPDGNFVVTASDDSTAKVWNTATGQLITDLKRHTNGVNSAAFSPDGKSIVTASHDGTAKIWNAVTGHLTSNLKGHKDGVHSAVFSPDGKFVLTASYDGTVRLWTAATGHMVVTIKANTKPVMTETFSPDGKLIVTVSGDSTARVWNASTGKLATRLKGHTALVSTGAFSPNAKWIVTASEDRTARVWNAATGKLITQLRGHSSEITGAAFSPDGKLMVTGLFDNTAKVWNAVAGHFIANLKGHHNSIESIAFSPGNKTVVTGSMDYTVKIWNGANGQMMADFKNNVGDYKAAVSPDGKLIITASRDTPKIWNAITGKLITYLQLNNGGQTWSSVNTSFSPGGELVATDVEDLSRPIAVRNIVKVWNTATGHLVSELTGHTGLIYNSAFSADGKSIVTSSTDSTAKVWNIATGQIIADLRGHNGYVNRATFSPDGNWLVTASADSTAKIWNSVTGQLAADLQGHNGSVESAAYSPDGKKVLTVSGREVKLWDAMAGELKVDWKDPWIKGAKFINNGKWVLIISHENLPKIWDAENGSLVWSLQTEKNEKLDERMDFTHNRVLGINNSEVSVYDMESGKKLYTSVGIDSMDYLTQIPSGYYLCTPNAAKFIHYVDDDLNVISFEQLDVKYNRPDLVLEAIGSPDTSLIKSYNKAWQKRITKLGFDSSLFTDGFHVPVADISRDTIQYEQTSNTLSLTIKAKDDSTVLDRYNAWINEVPLFGVRGISLKNRNTKHFDTTITVTLSNGNNRIESSVTNVGGLESYRVPLDVKYESPQPVKEKLYFIGMGIDHFNDSRYNLSWSVKDILDLARNFRKKYGLACIKDTLFDKDVSIEKVKALKQQLLKTTENDKVIVAYSGHGLLSKDYDYFLSTFNVNFQQPQEDGLPYEMLEDLLDGIPARKKLMLIDACHSGEVDKEEVSKMVKAQAGLDSTKKGVILLTDTTNKKLGTRNSFELMQEVFVNVGRSTGATIISAAAGTQFALERGDLKNGVFSYSILELMKDKTSITVSELRQYVNKRVTELTHGMQVPTSRNENKMMDWLVW